MFLFFLLSATNLFAQAAYQLTLSTGCGKKPVKTGTFTLTAKDGRSATRSFLVQVPADYKPSQSYALVFVFHGAGGSSQQSYSWGLQNAKGAPETAIFAFPQGVNFQNDGIGWDDRRGGYDLPFFDNMVTVLKNDYCIDSGRVFAAGFSWGGDFVTSLSCNRGDVLRGAAVNSASDEYKNTHDYATYAGLPCPSRHRPATRFVHAVDADFAYPAPDFATTSQLFRYFNGCSAQTRKIYSSSSVISCITYGSCQSELVECAFDKRIGHALPPNWPQDTWDFFASFH